MVLIPALMLALLAQQWVVAPEALLGGRWPWAAPLRMTAWASLAEARKMLHPSQQPGMKLLQRLSFQAPGRLMVASLAAAGGLGQRAGSLQQLMPADVS